MKIMAVILAVLLLILTGECISKAEEPKDKNKTEKETITIYDNEGQVKARVRDGIVYDSQWERRGYVDKDGKVFDHEHRLKYQIKDDRIYDRNWKPQGYIKNNQIYDKGWNRKGRIKKGR